MTLLTKAQQRAVAKAWARNIKRREAAVARERSEHSSPLPTEGDKSRDEQAPTVSADPGGSHE